MKDLSDLAAALARCEALQREQEELARFALIGQAFLGLAHELNNALHSMMLQTSVVQMRVDEQTRQELETIRQQGAQAAALVRTLQQAVQEQREKSHFIDLNIILKEVLEEQTELGRRVSMGLASCQVAPQIYSSTRSTVKQLVRLLLEGVCAGTETTVQAATAAEEGSAVLNLTIAGAEGDASTAEALLWRNLDEVSRLAGQSLLRQLGGTVTAERTDDALILHIVWRQSA